ncbi:retrotransposon protein, putative, unclassified [Tanacetum coccineum]
MRGERWNREGLGVVMMGFGVLVAMKVRVQFIFGNYCLWIRVNGDIYGGADNHSAIVGFNRCRLAHGSLCGSSPQRFSVSRNVRILVGIGRYTQVERRGCVVRVGVGRNSARPFLSGWLFTRLQFDYYSTLCMRDDRLQIGLFLYWCCGVVLFVIASRAVSGEDVWAERALCDTVWYSSVMFETLLDMLEQLKKFIAFKPHAMSTSSNKSFTSFSKWILDSGATHYMYYLLSQFISLNLNSLKSIMAANGEFVLLEGVGSVDTPSIALSKVFYIPSLTMNLASVSKICDSRCDVNFSVSNCSIYDQKTQEVVGTGHRQGDLYVLDHFRDNHGIASSSVDLSSFWLNRSLSAFYLWHSRLGHVSAMVAGKAVTTATTITGSMHQVVHTSISLYRLYGFFLADARLRSRIHNEKLVQTLLKGHFTLSLEDSLSRDYNVKKNGKWSYKYAVGSQKYQVVCTRPDIASTSVDMLDGVRIDDTRMSMKLRSYDAAHDGFGAIHLSRNHVFHERTKHINMRYHFIREVLEAKTIEVLKVGTEHNAAEALTKVLKFHKMTDAQKKCGMPSNQIWWKGYESKRLKSTSCKQLFEGLRYQTQMGFKSYERFNVFLVSRDSWKAGVSTEDANQIFSRSLPSALVTMSEQLSMNQIIEVQPKVWSDAPIIEEYESNSDDENGTGPLTPLDELSRLHYNGALLPLEGSRGNTAMPELYNKMEVVLACYVLNRGAAKSSCTKFLVTVSTTDKASGTNLVNNVSIPVSTASPNEGLSLSDTTNSQEDDSEIPPLEDIMKITTDDALEVESWVDAMLRRIVLRFEIHKKFGSLEDLPYGKKAIGTKQEEGIDYDEVFAPVARLEAIRIFLAFASYMGFIVYQMDVKSAFLYGKIDEEFQSMFKSMWLISSLGSIKKPWCDEFEALMKSRFQMSSMGELTFFLGLQVKQKPDGIFISQDKKIPPVVVNFLAETHYLAMKKQNPFVGILYRSEYVAVVASLLWEVLWIQNQMMRNIGAISSVCQQDSQGQELSKKHRVHARSLFQHKGMRTANENISSRVLSVYVMPEDKIVHMEKKNAQVKGRTREMVDEETRSFDEDRL